MLQAEVPQAFEQAVLLALLEAHLAAAVATADTQR